MASAENTGTKGIKACKKDVKMKRYCARVNKGKLMSPDPTDRQRLTRALVYGAVLSAAGVALFVLLFIGMSGLDNTPRLFISMCIPPAIIALVLGVYILVVRGRQSP